jgi:hypothetical protein
VLKAAGLVTERRQANRVIYSLAPERLATTVGSFLSTVCPEKVLSRSPRKKRSKAPEKSPAKDKGKSANRGPAARAVPVVGTGLHGAGSLWDNLNATD